MQKINLEEIIKLYSLNDTITTRQSFIYFGKQLLELADENARNNCITYDAGEPYLSNASKIILDTIRQIE